MHTGACPDWYATFVTNHPVFGWVDAQDHGSTAANQDQWCGCPQWRHHYAERYIEFICLREVKVPQFLLDTLNRLEKALENQSPKRAKTIQPLLDCITPNFNLPQAPSLEQSQYIHSFTSYAWTSWSSRQTPLDLQGIKLVGVYLAGMASNLPSQQYWQLVNVGSTILMNYWLPKSQAVEPEYLVWKSSSPKTQPSAAEDL